MKSIKKFLRDEQGQALPFFALLVVILFGFTALAFDWGMFNNKKADYQKAADSAALAAAIDYPQKLTTLGSLTQVSKDIMTGVAVKMVQKNHPGISPADIEVTFPVLNRVKVKIDLPFDSYFAGAANFGKPKFTSTVDDLDEDDHVIAVAQKRTVWDGFALPLINMSTFSMNGTIDLRDHDDNLNSWREWLNGKPDAEDFEKYQTPSGTLPIEQMRINPLDGLYVRGGNTNVYNVQLTQPIMKDFPGDYFVFSINPIIISTISTRGIAVLDKVGGNFIPVKTDSSYVVAPYAKLVGDKYIPWVEGDPIADRIEQIVLLKVAGATMDKGGNGDFAGTVVGQFSISTEVETAYGKNKARLVE